MTDALTTDATLLPAPLRGCLYCHAEGTVTLGESRKVLGIGSSTPLLTCSQCSAVAQFEEGATADEWRIRYRSANHAARYYYVWLHLGQAGWLDADAALTASLYGFVQRYRLQQVLHGELNWLRPAPLTDPPSLMSPSELVYLTLNPASLRQASKRNGVLAMNSEDPVQDVGRCYVTDQKLHLLGQRRDWAHKLSEVQRVDQTERYWRVYVGDSGQYYQGENLPGQMDAQLFAAVIRVLCKPDLNYNGS